MKLLNCVWLFATPWTVACQAPLSMGYSSIVAWSMSKITPGIFPTEELNQDLLHCRQTLYHEPPEKLKKVKVAQLCPTFRNLMDCSPPGSSVHGILQPRTLEWVGILFSRGSSQPGDQTQVSTFQADSLASEPPGKPIYFPSLFQKGRWPHRYNLMGLIRFYLFYPS